MDPEELPLVAPETPEEEIPTLVDLAPPFPPTEAYPEEVWDEKTISEPVLDLI